MRTIREQLEAEPDPAAADKKVDSDILMLTNGLSTFVTSLQTMVPAKMPLGSKWAQVAGSPDGAKKLQDLTNTVRASLVTVKALQDLVKKVPTPQEAPKAT